MAKALDLMWYSFTCLLNGGVVRLVDSLHLILVQLGSDLSLKEPGHHCAQGGNRPAVSVATYMQTNLHCDSWVAHIVHTAVAAKRVLLLHCSCCLALFNATNGGKKKKKTDERPQAHPKMTT